MPSCIVVAFTITFSFMQIQIRLSMLKLSEGGQSPWPAGSETSKVQGLQHGYCQMQPQWCFQRGKLMITMEETASSQETAHALHSATQALPGGWLSSCQEQSFPPHQELWQKQCYLHAFPTPCPAGSPSSSSEHLGESCLPLRRGGRWFGLYWIFTTGFSKGNPVFSPAYQHHCTLKDTFCTTNDLKANALLPKDTKIPNHENRH